MGELRSGDAGDASGFAELESDIISDRTKEGMAAMRARGEVIGGNAPAGKIRAGKIRAGKRLRDCPPKRPITREIHRLSTVERWSIYQIYDWLRHHKVTRRNCQPCTYDVVRRALEHEREWQFDESQPEERTHAAAGS